MKPVMKTPLTQMAVTSILNKMGEFAETLVRELNFTENAVNEQLIDFARLSVRIAPEKGEFDFEPALASDEPEQIRIKFKNFIRTGCYSNVEAGLKMIDQADKPLTPREQQPEKLPEDADPQS